VRKKQKKNIDVILPNDPILHFISSQHFENGNELLMHHLQLSITDILVLQQSNAVK